MKIQQAIFTSSDRSQIKGYQIVAKSADIDRNIAQELHRWSPSQMGNDDPAGWTINYFPVSENSVAVARTVLGGPEYSSRGSSQVVTIMAVLRNEQFAAYHNNAVLVAQTAIALGWLRLPVDTPGRSLGAFELPDHPFVEKPRVQKLLDRRPADNAPTRGSARGDPVTDDPQARLLVELAELVDQKKRFAVIGARDPIETVAKLILRLSIHTRRELSFTTGLLPALHRPFQAHFLPDSNPILNQMLKSEGIRLIQMPE